MDEFGGTHELCKMEHGRLILSPQFSFKTSFLPLLEFFKIIARLTRMRGALQSLRHLRKTIIGVNYFLELFLSQLRPIDKCYSSSACSWQSFVGLEMHRNEWWA
jgi:hypothetical protein